MSIHVGFQSDNYSLNKLTSTENKLFIDNYTYSNVIDINTAPNTTEKSFINFKNRFLTGISSNTYIIHNLQENRNILQITSNIVCNSDIYVKDLIAMSSNTTIFTSNIIHQFKHAQNRLTIYNNNQTVFEVSPSYTTINNVKVSDTIYTDRIVNYTGSSIQIVNPTLVGLTLESFNTEQSVIVKNIFSKYYTTPTFLINRFDNLKNIIEIGTCNIRNSDVARQLTLNRQGMLGIGSQAPDAPLSISATIHNNPYVFKYTGSNVTDITQINKTGYIGIGTTSSKGMLHIYRGDNLQEVRNDSLIKLDIAYDSNYNIVSTSNIVSFINKDNFQYYVNISKQSTLSTDHYDYAVLHEVYLLNTQAYPQYSNIFYTKNNLKLYTNNPKITNPQKDSFIIENQYYYPSNIYTYERTADFSYSSTYTINVEFHTSPTSNTSNFITSHYFNHGIVLMTPDTYYNAGYVSDLANPRYNADKFQITYGYYSNVDDLRYKEYNITNNHSSNFINNIYYCHKIYIENVKHNFDYHFPITPITYDPPYFLHMSSNNSFKVALSSYGTLSLGSLDTSNKYLLYADGACLLKNAEINTITTSNSYLDFKNINISNIAKIYASSNFINQAYIDSCSISNAYIYIQECSNLMVSNLTINAMQSSFFTMKPANIHIIAPVSVANNYNNLDSYPNSLIKSIVPQQIPTANTYYKHRRGIIVANDFGSATSTDKIHPSISIIGYDASIPYVNLGRIGVAETTDYFLRINNRTFSINGNSENTDIFELCCDNINIQNTARIQYFNNISLQPSFMNHYKKFNLLTLGELPNVCVQCTNNFSTQASLNSVASTTFTNGTNKISIGFPYGIAINNSFNIQEWPQYFNNILCNMNADTNNGNKYAPYMLNIFGNVAISSIYGKTIMTMRADDGSTRNQSSEAVNITVGSFGDSTTSMTIHGSLDIKGQFFNTQSASGSDSNIKADLVVIENALEKINSISGYTFSNLISERQDTGLVAQEVQKILPEAIIKSKDSDLLYLAYGNMMGLVVESIKALDRKFETMNTRLDHMEKKINFLASK